MSNALLRTVLTKIKYGGQDVQCDRWSGLIELVVTPNGEFPASVIFGPLTIAHGQTLETDIPIYDGVGGVCDGRSKATLNFRITAYGTGTMGHEAFGTIFDPSNTHPDPIPPDASKGEYTVIVPVINPRLPKSKASLWFTFSVVSMC